MVEVSTVDVRNLREIGFPLTVKEHLSCPLLAIFLSILFTSATIRNPPRTPTAVCYFTLL